MKDASAGNSALEILIALAILSIVMVAVIMMTFGNQTVSAETQINTEAMGKARLTLEKAVGAARQNFSSIISSSSVDDIYTRSLVVTDLSPCRKRIISRVSWSTDPLRPEQIELTSDVADGTLLAYGENCEQSAPTDPWTNPHTLGTIDLGQSKATGIDVKNNLVYLSAEAAAASKPDFYIVDVSNPATPTIKSSVDLSSIGLNAVDVAGTYAFVANEETTNQLKVIDVSNPISPTVVNSTTLTIPVGTASGLSVFYYNSRVYIGTTYTTSTSSHELHVYNVTTPSSPTFVGSIDVGRQVNGIFVKGPYAYLAVGSASGDLKDIIVYTISGPTPIEIASVNLPGGGAKSIYLVGSTLYVGTFKMTGKNDFYIYDVSTPSAPTLLGQTRLGADINSLRVAGSFAFVATTDSNKEFQVLNISNPASITPVSSLNFPQEATGLDYENGLVYSAVRSNDPLRIIMGH